MLVQISSGQGPAECEIAVGKLFNALQKEYADIERVSDHKSRYSPKDGYTSILFRTGHDLSALEGSVLWICKSPVRPGHKRKNWYVDVSIIDREEEDAPAGKKKRVTAFGIGETGEGKNAGTGGKAAENDSALSSAKKESEPVQEQPYREQDIRIETYHSSGKGGQNVNKVETGVRITHIPTGITVTSTAERSQYLNKQDALRKLSEELVQRELQKQQHQINSAWREHTRIVRGDPVRVYVGVDFKRSMPVDLGAARFPVG